MVVGILKFYLCSLKTSENFGFSTFTGVVEMERWREIGHRISSHCFFYTPWKQRFSGIFIGDREGTLN